VTAYPSVSLASENGFFVTFGKGISVVPRLFEGVRISFDIYDSESKQIEFGAAVHGAFD
jgi:hypothetical protein